MAVTVALFADDAAQIVIRTPPPRWPCAPARRPVVLTEEDSFKLDQDEVNRFVSELASLRAGVVLDANHPAGLETPVASVQATLQNGERRQIVFGRTLEGAFAKSTVNNNIFQIAPSFTLQLTHPKEAWYNRQLVSIERTTIHRMAFTDETGKPF